MSDKLMITPVESPEDRKAFVEFQWEIYKDDPYWVPPFLSDCEELLNAEHHPFYEHAEVQHFLARRDDEVVGRITALVNHNHNKHWNEKVGFFGLYEVLDDQEVSDALLETAENFTRQQGMTAIRGPVNFSTNEECGLLVDGWNGPPKVLMTYNPKYYKTLIESRDYVSAQDLLAYIVDLTQFDSDGANIPAKLVRVANKIRERMDVTIRPINMRDFDAEAARFKKVYNAAWASNWGFVPLTEAELENEIKALKPVIDPETVLFAELDKQTVGALVPLPDLCQPLHRAYPKPGVPEWWSMAKMLYWWKVRKSVTTIRAFAGGVIDEYRGRGVSAVLMLEGLLACIRQGYKEAEISWVLESNQPMRQMAELVKGKVYRTYRIYEKAL